MGHGTWTQEQVRTSISTCKKMTENKRKKNSTKQQQQSKKREHKIKVLCLFFTLNWPSESVLCFTIKWDWDSICVFSESYICHSCSHSFGDCDCDAALSLLYYCLLLLLPIVVRNQIQNVVILLVLSLFFSCSLYVFIWLSFLWLHTCKWELYV